MLKFCLLALSILSSTPAFSETKVEELSAKIQKLEDEFEKMNSKSVTSQDRVRTFFSQSVALGGYLENGVTSIWGPNTKTQTVADSQRLGINLAAEINQRMQIVSQMTFGFAYPLRNEHNNPSHGSSLIPTQRSYGEITYGSLLTQAYLDYTFSDSMHLQSGMGYVPFGQSFQVREPVLFNKRRGPQLIRTSGVTKVIIAHPFWQGLNLVMTPSKSWRFNFYTHSPLDHSGKLGGGGRVEYGESKSLVVGASFQAGEQGDTAYRSSGVDFKMDWDTWGLQMEYAKNSTKIGSPESFYVQPFVRIFDEQLLIFVMADYLKNPFGETTLGTSSIADPYIKWEKTLGLVYFFLPNVRARLDYTEHDYVGTSAVVSGQNRDYRSMTISLGASF